MEERHEICPVEELPPGERKIVEISGKEIGIFNVKGNFHALRNVCPHQRAPLCKGPITGTSMTSKAREYNWIRDGEILRCPWHGWEFDIITGESIFNPHRVKTTSYEVEVESKNCTAQECVYGTKLEGDEPPVDTYQVEVEQEMVVLYL